ncbi:fibronectin type III domain-containing protein, partial [Candidatus Giovannonibacteria bacterium]|nr:fibronectin type III domain-containing protein [Candidatus Giovannonibacteria bacterium]
ADTTPPSAPAGLAVTGVTATGINLSWTASTDNVAVTGYKVERCQGAACTTFAQVGTPAGTTFNDTALLGNTTYRYQVRANDAAGNNSAYSSIVNGTTDATAPTQSAIASSAITSSGATITWTTNESSNSTVDYGLTTGYGSSAVNASMVTSHSVNLTGLSASTLYHYRVKSTDAAGNTATSADFTFTTLAAATATDWIGLYTPGALDSSYIDWIYVSCSKTPGGSSAAGSCSFVLPVSLASGPYEFRLFANDTFNLIATSNNVNVDVGISASPSSSFPGDTITATWGGIPTPTATDWIGLYTPGAANNAWIDWIYVSCSKTAGSALADGSCPFVLPSSLAAGTYNVTI